MKGINKAEHVEVVIKIPKYYLTHPLDYICLDECIRRGVILPKGHGKLKNVDELHSIFKKNCDAYDIDNLSFISDMDMNFDLTSTIVEADKNNVIK